MEKLIIQFSEIVNSPILLTGFLIVLSFLFAKISDFVFSFLIKKIVAKTSSDIDNQIVDYLHKPIYYSILFVGLTLTLETLEQIPNSIDPE